MHNNLWLWFVPLLFPNGAYASLLATPLVITDFIGVPLVQRKDHKHKYTHTHSFTWTPSCPWQMLPASTFSENSLAPCWLDFAGACNSYNWSVFPAYNWSVFPAMWIRTSGLLFLKLVITTSCKDRCRQPVETDRTSILVKNSGNPFDQRLCRKDSFTRVHSLRLTQTRSLRTHLTQLLRTHSITFRISTYKLSLRTLPSSRKSRYISLGTRKWGGWIRPWGLLWNSTLEYEFYMIWERRITVIGISYTMYSTVRICIHTPKKTFILQETQQPSPLELFIYSNIQNSNHPLSKE
jgi:hypothetical protein